MAYANGNIPDSELVTIPGGARLLAPVAVIWLAVCAEVLRRHGWSPAPTGPLDGYRPLSGNYYAQLETFLRRYQRTYTEYAKGKVDARKHNGVTYYRKPGEAAAAPPGTSNHGWACAIDVSGLGGDPVRYAEFAAVAIPRGLSNVEGLSVGERWHWTDPSTVIQVKRGVTFPGVVPHVPSVTAPAPLTPVQEDDMPIIVTTPSGSWLKDGPRLDGLDLPARDSCRAAGLREISVSDALRDAWARQTAPVPTLVRAPNRGVAILAGAGGFTHLSSQEDVNAFNAAGAREVLITDDDFNRLATEGA